MRARGFFIFVVLNVLITAGVAFAVVSMLGPTTSETSEAPERFATVLLIITATPDPNSTPIVRIITATPEPGTIATLPTGVLDPQPTTVAAAPGSTELGQSAAPQPTPTVDPALAADPAAQATISALPPGCILHVLADGESPGRLAEIYDTDVFAILEVNGLTEDEARFLQIGQTLVVPLEGCSLISAPPSGDDDDDTAAPAATLAPGETAQPTLTPTVTLAPTAENAQVEVDQVLGAGDITSEHLVIINRGATVNLTGWTLSDLDGNVYTFPETRLFNDGLIEVWTQVGENTPLRRYWGLTRPVWGDTGDVITLKNATGAVQATVRISGD